MKDSGIDWIGKIPDEWEVKRLKFVSKNRNEKYDEQYGMLDYFSLENIESQSARYVETKNEYDISQSLICKKEDVVFGKLRPYLAKVYKVEKMSCCSSEFAIFYNFEGDSSFLKYYFLSDGFVKIVDSSTYGTKMPRANIDFIRNMQIPFPPLSEQTKIAGFLDKKCSEIDSIIEESKNSIEEYKAWKQSVIFEAVTGKNLSCKKKNSGIEWLGEIPENFTITRIKHIATLAGRIGWQGLTSQEYSDEGCYLITGINFSNGEINWESCVRVPYSRWEEATQIQIENGDLLITKDGTVGKVAIVNNMPDKTSLNSGVLLIRQNKKVCSTRFLFWILQSNIFWKWFNYINAGNSTIIHLYQHDFSNFSFPNPSIKIQNEISNYLDKKCAQIDSLISEKQSLIKDLAEYKKSLIFEAVTGKRRV